MTSDINVALSIDSLRIFFLRIFIKKLSHISIFFKGSILYITNLTFTRTSLLDKAFHICCNLHDRPLSECALNWYLKSFWMLRILRGISDLWWLPWQKFPDTHFICRISLMRFLCHTIKYDSWKRGLICNVSTTYIVWYLVEVWYMVKVSCNQNK